MMPGAALVLTLAVAASADGGVRPQVSHAAQTARESLRLKRFPEAAATLRAAATRGDRDAQYLLGLVSINGIGTELAHEPGIRWLTAAAGQSHRDAAFALAGLLAHGKDDGSERNPRAARDWLARAAAAGHPLAQRLHAAGQLPMAPVKPGHLSNELSRELLIAAISAGNVEYIRSLAAVAVNSRDSFGRTPLHQAVTRGSSAAIALLLETGAAADEADSFGVTSLMLAAEAPHENALDVLLPAVRNLESRDKAGNTALAYSARAGRVAQLLRLIAAGASVNSRNAAGWTPLDMARRAGREEILRVLAGAGAVSASKTRAAHAPGRLNLAGGGVLYDKWPAIAVAVSRNDVQSVSELLASGMRPDWRSHRGDTLLLLAAKARAPDVISPLLRAGLNPSTADSNGRSALGYAAARGDTAALGALLAAGVSPDTRAAKEEPPLVQAVRAGHTEAVRLLLESGAQPRSAPEALWYAAAEGHDEIVGLLAKAGAPPDKHRLGLAPLHVAAAGGHLASARALLERGAPVNAPTLAGDTPLMLAASAGSEEVVRLLVDSKADVNATNRAGDTALIAAARSGEPAVCGILLSAGANAKIRNDDQLDALDVARRSGHTQIADLLRRR